MGRRSAQGPLLRITFGTHRVLSWEDKMYLTTLGGHKRERLNWIVTSGWGHWGFSVCPCGVFPSVHVCVRVFLGRTVKVQTQKPVILWASAGTSQQPAYSSVSSAVQFPCKELSQPEHHEAPVSMLAGHCTMWGAVPAPCSVFAKIPSLGEM